MAVSMSLMSWNFQPSPFIVARYSRVPMPFPLLRPDGGKTDSPWSRQRVSLIFRSSCKVFGVK